MERAYLFFQNSLKSTESLLKVILISKWFAKRQYKKTQHRRPVCILGNGPSLNTTLEKHANKLSSMDLLGVNSMAVSGTFSQLKPRYYILGAQTYFKTDSELIELYIQMNNETYEALEQRVTWEMCLFLPLMAKKSGRVTRLLSANKHIRAIFYNPTPVEGFNWFKQCLFSAKLGMPRPHNIIIPALMNLIWLGHNELYIVGADHSWLKEISVNEGNDALVEHKHFYSKYETQPVKMQDRITHARKLHEVIEKFYLTFKGYWELKPFAAKKGVNIYNASEVSMIDAFERVKW